jgi:hypothetical protein
LIGQAEQTFFQEQGKRRRTNIEAQVNCAGHFIDVLPAGALSTDCGKFNFIVRYDGDVFNINPLSR